MAWQYQVRSPCHLMPKQRTGEPPVVPTYRSLRDAMEHARRGPAKCFPATVVRVSVHTVYTDHPVATCSSRDECQRVGPDLGRRKRRTKKRSR
jgi:hypothetical protein